MANEDGFWLSIIEYSHFKKISVSTIRRRIKSKNLKFKEVNGRYFIFSKTRPHDFEDRNRIGVDEVERLKKENEKLKELIKDYQSLVNLYEKSAPPLPTDII